MQLRSHPKEIMNDVLKTLRDLGINWKKTGAYNLKCRWVAPGQNSNDTTAENHSLPDSPMAGSMPRASSCRWSSEQHGVSGSVAAGNRDNESGVESNVLKFELQVRLFKNISSRFPSTVRCIICLSRLHLGFMVTSELGHSNCQVDTCLDQGLS